MAETDEVGTSNSNTAYEASDWPLLPVGLTLSGVLLAVLIATFALKWAYPDAVEDVGRTLLIEPPPPRLQTSPQDDLGKFEAEQSRRLNSYYWIDKSKGIVHVPIEQAMRKLAREGIDGLPKASR